MGPPVRGREVTDAPVTAAAVAANSLRPEWQTALGWVAVAAFSWHLVLAPAAFMLAPFAGVELPKPTPIDIAEAATLVGSALGLGFLKSKGTP